MRTQDKARYAPQRDSVHFLIKESKQVKFITREGNRSRALHARSGITEIPGARRTFSFPGRKMKEGGKKSLL